MNSQRLFDVASSSNVGVSEVDNIYISASSI